MNKMVLVSQDPDYANRVIQSFGRQSFMEFIGARLAVILPGYCEIEVDYRKELLQQHGFFHAGIVGTLADNAAGYAGYSLMAASSSVLTVEYKLNLLGPGDGEMLRAKAHVLKYGKTLTICRADVFAIKGGEEILCAAAQVTLMELKEKPDEKK